MESLKFRENSEKFKILELSNAVYTPSGYGVQSAGMLYDWNKHYNVRQLANYGLEGRMIALNGLPIYPTLTGDVHGDKTARLIFRNWSPDIFITLYDIWMGAYIDAADTPAGIVPIHPYWIPIVMVDHEPIPESTLVQAKEAFRVVTPTQFGYNEFARNGVECHLIPFGIHTNTFKPSMDKGVDKKYLNTMSAPFDTQKTMPFDEDSFVIVINGANKDPYRKDFPRAFIAIQLFLQKHPQATKNTRVYVHSWMRLARDIPHDAKVLHVEPFSRGANDYHMLMGVPDEGMARIYGAADVFLHMSQGGGFEIPLLEALSCGVPVIAQDFVGNPELVKDHGWLIPSKTKYFTPLSALQSIADEFATAEALEEAYYDHEKRKKLGDAGREFALKYDWKHVNPLWYKLIEDIRSEWAYKPPKQRRL